GDLDFAGRGAYDPAFEKALFELEEGKISDAVRSEYGYHLIKLTGVEKATVASLADKKAELQQKLVQDKAAEKLNEAVDELNRLAYESGDLAAVSEKFGKKVEESALFTRMGGAGIAADKKVIDAAFSDAVLKDGANSEAIELADGSLVVFRVGKHEPVRDQTLDEVKDTIFASLKQQKAREKASATADEVVARLQKGESLEALGDAFSLVWSNATDVNRQNAEISRSVVAKLFEMSRPAEGGRVVDKSAQSNGDQEILVLTKVKDGEFKFSNEEIVQNSLAGAMRFGQMEFENYMSTLKDGAEIVQY
ncbi:MAG TPA: peptidyl-prolyl cis-trans isomerase, partial [Dongiaceae bacterium]|nr:peptidyl-prolyl cis-trans isomerase [Dongiaceae bacterium]